MPDCNIITITGELGSGKSTIVGLLKERLPDYEIYSTGKAFRILACDRGLTLAELTALADADHSIDRQVDEKLMEYGKTATRAIVDSRMAWHFIPYSFKVRLTVATEIAAKRILSSDRGKVEKYATVEEAMESIRFRSNSERNRYLTMYGVDIADAANYDMMLDTSAITAIEAAGLILKAFNEWRAGGCLIIKQ